MNNKRGTDKSSNKDDSVERRTLVETAPKQILVWDITYMYKTNPQGEYYYLSLSWTCTVEKCSIGKYMMYSQLR